jgi:hypothetical protein
VRGCRWTIGSLRTLFGPDWYHLHARGTPSHLYDGAPLKGRAGNKLRRLRQEPPLDCSGLAAKGKTKAI